MSSKRKKVVKGWYLRDILNTIYSTGRWIGIRDKSGSIAFKERVEIRRRKITWAYNLIINREFKK